VRIAGAVGGVRFPGAVTAALPADGAVVAAWLDQSFSRGGRHLSGAATGTSCLRAAGGRAVAAWQQGDRLRLAALTGPR
jgi:hypothetical protein